MIWVTKPASSTPFCGIRFVKKPFGRLGWRNYAAPSLLSAIPTHSGSYNVGRIAGPISNIYWNGTTIPPRSMLGGTP